MARTPAATCAAVYKSVYDVAKGGERQVDKRSLTQALAGGASGALPLASGQVDQVELPNADCPLQLGTILNVSSISVLPHVARRCSTILGCLLTTHGNTKVYECWPSGPLGRATQTALVTILSSLTNGHPSLILTDVLINADGQESPEHF